MSPLRSPLSHRLSFSTRTVLIVVKPSPHISVLLFTVRLFMDHATLSIYLSVLSIVLFALCFFHNRVRLLNHLKYRSTVCRLNLMMSGPLISVEQADVLDEGCRDLRRRRYAAGLRAHSVCAEPCFRLCGPLPLPLIIDGSKHTNNCHMLGFGRNYH